MRMLLAGVLLVGSISTAAAQASSDPKEVAVYNACILSYLYQCEHGGKATNAPAATIKACLAAKLDRINRPCRDALNALQ